MDGSIRAVVGHRPDSVASLVEILDAALHAKGVHVTAACTDGTHRAASCERSAYGLVVSCGSPRATDLDRLGFEAQAGTIELVALEPVHGKRLSEVAGQLRREELDVEVDGAQGVPGDA